MGTEYLFWGFRSALSHELCVRSNNVLQKQRTVPHSLIIFIWMLWDLGWVAVVYNWHSKLAISRRHGGYTMPSSHWVQSWYASCVFQLILVPTSQKLALTAASPLYRGYIADVDCRWNVIAGSVDDRTPEERSLKVSKKIHTVDIYRLINLKAS